MTVTNDGGQIMEANDDCRKTTTAENEHLSKQRLETTNVTNNDSE